MRRLSRRFFFFQAEDGIRDLYVTGVQTCALPIWGRMAQVTADDDLPVGLAAAEPLGDTGRPENESVFTVVLAGEIGRASCRERVWIAVGAVSVKKKSKACKGVEVRG